MRRYRPGGPAGGRANGGVMVPDPFAMVRAYESDTNPTRPIRPSPLTASTIQGLPLDLLDRLRSFPLFLSAPDTFLAAVGMHLKPQLHQAHDTILTEGEQGKAMYWLVRGSVRVTSRDGESTYAELKPGAFFGAIGILMNIPRTATVTANTRSLVVRLNKEALEKELPKFPDVEHAIMDEAKERLAILERKKKEVVGKKPNIGLVSRPIKRTIDRVDGDVVMGERGAVQDGEVISQYKKRKSPSPGLADVAAMSVFGNGSLPVRLLLKELPLFSSLPSEILHFIGLNAQPCHFPPFTDILKQGTQGRDVYFIVKGEVEVVNTQMPIENGNSSMAHGRRKSIAAGEHSLELYSQVKARLRPGQYFGEVTSLSLAPLRTATVRSVSSVECLMISGDVLNQLWDMCGTELRRQVEQVATERLKAAKDSDTIMTDATETTAKIDSLILADLKTPRTPRKGSVPTVTFEDTPPSLDSPLTPSRREGNTMEPYDPDPFLNVDLDNVRSRSRRGSLAPPPPDSPALSSIIVPKSPSPSSTPLSPSPLFKHVTTPPEPAFEIKRPRVFRRPSRFNKGLLPDSIVVNIFKYLDLCELMRLRLVTTHWKHIIHTSPDILHTLDLKKYNRKVTDRTLQEIICPFVGNRPTFVDISNCFHVTDEGFAALGATCAPNVKIWRMKSVWDITGPAVLEMVQKAKGLEEVDLSNCRKVGDNLLARVIGWVVPELPPAMMQAQQAQMAHRRSFGQKGANGQPAPQPLPPGTVVGCPKLRRLTLSYCKHITDRSMAHIAVHASNRLEQIDLTRCTTITDMGFQHWSVYSFPRLTKLCLADCTYLTDNAIVYLTNAAKGLRELDLVSFSCLLFSPYNAPWVDSTPNAKMFFRPHIALCSITNSSTQIYLAAQRSC